MNHTTCSASHADTDEAFLVLEGQLRIDLRDGDVLVQQRELYVVPKGTEHKSYAEHEVNVMLIELRGVLNTGDKTEAPTAVNDIWI